MDASLDCLAALAACTLFAASAFAQSARDIRGPSPLVAIDNEAPARLIVDPPLPDQLAQGLVFIQYRTENLRVLPVFGKGALDVSPRIGHVHITVDDAPWPLRRRQRRDDDRGRAAAGPAQGAVRTGRPDAPGDHQRDREFHAA